MSRSAPARPGGYSLLEMLLVVLILMMVSTLVMTSYGNVDRTQRLENASTELTQAIRFARAMSMASANTTNPASPARYGVAFDLTNQKVWVFQSTAPTTPIASNLFANGQYLLDFARRQELSQVRMTASTITTQSNGVRYITFDGLGAKSSFETLTLSYGGASVVLAMPMAGDVTTQ